MVTDLQKALAALSRDDVIKLTRDVIDIPSPMGGEKELADYLAGRFRDLGLDVRTQEVEPGRPNVIATHKGTGGGASLMLFGHMDTTWAGDEEGIRELGPGYQPSSYMDGDWIYGAGAYNMKSGLASAIAAFEAIVRSGVRPAGDLIMACVVGETCHTQVRRYQGARYRGCGVGANFMVGNGVSADMAVCPEPTSGRVSIASGGYVYFEIRISGNPGATYARGGKEIKVKPAVDAIEKSQDVLAAIRDWAPGYKRAHTYRGQEATNVAVVAMEAGHPWRPTKLAPFSRIYLEVDTVPGQRVIDVVREVEALMEDCRSRDAELDLELNVIQTPDGAEVAEDEYVVGAISRAHTAVHGIAPEVTFDSWVADTATLIRAGIPAICYGPAGRSAFGGSGYYPVEGEHANADDLFKGSQVYIHLALEACNLPREHQRERPG
ncbi:MAG: M20/M25/M40 family metallo-hydrolase [Chloroflexi bacterium]|nr:M20/M25/M40 family metallo-hydrolase [Chloroflexota bacterium]